MKDKKIQVMFVINTDKTVNVQKIIMYVDGQVKELGRHYIGNFYKRWFCFSFVYSFKQTITLRTEYIDEKRGNLCFWCAVMSPRRKIPLHCLSFDKKQIFKFPFIPKNWLLQFGFAYRLVQILELKLLVHEILKFTWYLHDQMKQFYKF